MTSVFKDRFPHQAPIKAKAGEYEQAGKTKTRYVIVGQAFASPDRHHILMRINTQPLNWDGGLYLDFEESDSRKVDPAKNGITKARETRDKIAKHEFGVADA